MIDTRPNGSLPRENFVLTKKLTNAKRRYYMWPVHRPTKNVYVLCLFPVVDAAGKINSGIQRGSFYFVGSYDQCYMIEPEIHAGEVLGNVTVPSSRSLGTKFCRADIAIPESLIKSLNVVSTETVPLISHF